MFNIAPGDVCEIDYAVFRQFGQMFNIALGGACEMGTVTARVWPALQDPRSFTL